MDDASGASVAPRKPSRALPFVYHRSCTAVCAPPFVHRRSHPHAQLPETHMETEPQDRLSARITGRVQGVGFRNFTQTQARRLDVTGWVRNERDGSVRMEAEGTRKALESLADAVQDGPRLAQVQAVEAKWADATGEFDAFRVRW